MKAFLSLVVMCVLLALAAAPAFSQSTAQGEPAAGQDDPAAAPPLPNRPPDPPSFQDGLLAYHRGDPVSAFEIWKPMAERGHAGAQYSLGVLYQQGEGVVPDLRLAAHWYRKAAQRGDPDAQLNLGLLYAQGKGVRQDYVEAYKWFSLAFRAYAPGEYRDAAFRNRENAAAAMTEKQIQQADRLVEAWRGKTP